MAWYSIAGKFGNMAPQPKRPSFPLSVSDLWSSAQEPDYPEASTLINDPSQLSPEAQKRLRRDQLLKVLAAALGAQPGYMGTTALSAVANRGQDEQEAIDRANALAQQKFGFDRQKAALQAETMRTRAITQKEGQMAHSVIGKAQELWNAAADDPQFQARITSAAQRGGDSMEELAKLEAALPARKALRKAGVDPDDPMAVKAAQDAAAAKLKEEEKRKDREAEEKQRREHEQWLKSQSLGSYKPADRAPREGATVIGADGTPYLVDQATGRVISKIDIPGGVRQGGAGLDPWREAVRRAQADVRAGLVDNTTDAIRKRAQEYYELGTGGPGPVETVPPKGSPGLSGSGRGPAIMGPPAPPKRAAPEAKGGNARLIPGLKAKGSEADPFGAVKDPQAKAFAQRQLAAGVPMEKILAYLKQHGAL